ncbi:hypothetical protein BH23GEM9_BH23GEM9_04390 [soil metagenome]
MADTDPRKVAESFVGELRSVAGQRLQSALLFGSAARGEWLEGISDVNVLVLVDVLDAPFLASLAPAVRAAFGRGVTPLLMELDEWRRAADVFTIELADMKDASVTLHGDDPGASAQLQPGFMRLQAEREIRAKLLHLHAGMVMTADEPARLGQIFVHALPSLTTYMRTALRLAGRHVPGDSRTVIGDACVLADADPAPFLTVLDARRDAVALEIDLAHDPLADAFNTGALRLATCIDHSGENV